MERVMLETKCCCRRMVDADEHAREVRIPYAIRHEPALMDTAIRYSVSCEERRFRWDGERVRGFRLFREVSDA